MDYIQRIKHQALEFWQSRDRAQKIKIIVSTIIVVSVLSAIIYLISRPKYLYSDLDIKDAGEIVKNLMTIKYRIGLKTEEKPY